MWASFQRIKELLPKKLSLILSSQKYGFGIRDPEKKPIPDPESRGQKGTGSRIPEPGSGSATKNCYVNVFSLLFNVFFSVNHGKKCQKIHSAPRLRQT